MNLEIGGHVAVVTGGGRGIGAAISRALGNEGCKVAIWEHEPAATQELTAELEAAGVECAVFEVDVSRRTQVQRAAVQTLERFRRIDVLVNNAGFSRDVPIVEMTEEQWDCVIDVCLKGTFLCIQSVAPAMIAQRYGRIINIASRGYLGGESNKANYAAAKGGVISLTKALAHELALHGITVNAVAPGFVLTDRLRALPNYAQIEKRARILQPVKRHGLPDDQARAVLFLAARNAGYVTGEVLHVTGGRYG